MLTVPIVHQTHRYVVINKPSGLLSVPGIGAAKADCAAARVRGMFPECSGPLVVHRLDMETSGLMVFGLDPDAQRDLSLQFEDRDTLKRYIAIVDGIVEVERGEITLPLRLDVDNRPYQIVDHVQGKPAHTKFRVVAREIDRTRMEFAPTTGRSHQLRVHAATARGLGGLGHPILGDPLYGNGAHAERLMLHASYLSFRVPGAATRVEFECRPDF